MLKEKRNLTLYKQDFEKFFRLLSETFTIFGPSKTDGGRSFTKIDASDKIAFDYKNTKMSLKEFFFPQTETLFFFDSEKNEVKQTDVETNKHNILFGVRPCDALSISFLDKVFNENNPPDLYYTRRRKSTRIVSFACTNPASTCFCTSVGCGPDSETGSDIIFFDLDGRYFIKTVTLEGEKIIKSVEKLLNPATKNDIEEKVHLMKTANSNLKKIFDSGNLQKKLDNFNAPYWEKLHRKCLGCGICTYFCPTCHCFDITDEVIKSNGRRIRTWDSCMFSLFTLHASGHNPRPSQKERMRQRIMHKFNYAPKYYGKTFCVGCGRCIINCPVNMDIRDVMKEIMEER
ncbi:Anaerobic sulfite reductase subunit A [subsurface metagenome]